MHIHSKGHRTLIHLPSQYAFVKEEWRLLPWVNSPSVSLPNSFFFTFHIHTCLTDITHTISLMLLPNMQCRWDISKCLMAFHPKPISKIRENLPMKFGSCKSSHMIFLRCVSLTHSSIAKQSIITWYYNPNWSFHNQAMTLAIKFNKNLQFYLIQKWTCSFVGLL